MTQPCIITVAITGAVPRKKDNPAVPVTPAEQIESTHQAFEAGASLVHIHVREKDESSSSDPALFAEVQEGVRKHCPGMIVQFSTGGRGREMSERGAMLALDPEMASLATGSVNFPTSVYANPPDFVEDLARTMLYNAARLVDKGLLKAPAHVQFVFGIPNAMPARRKILDFLLSELDDVLPGATWTAAGVARHQFEVNKWCLELGGHCRTGLEDNIKFDRDRLAASNAELVARVSDICGDYGRHPASPAEARDLLGIRAT